MFVEAETRICERVREAVSLAKSASRMTESAAAVFSDRDAQAAVGRRR
jgi:hypothetical protein